MTAVVDSGVLYALVDAGDSLHDECVAAVAEERETVIVPMPILPEVCTLIGSRLGASAERDFIRYLMDSEWRLEALMAADVPRVLTLMSHGGEAGIGFTDAAVAAIAERMNATRVYTLDRRHFDLIRPSHVERFELLPER